MSTAVSSLTTRILLTLKKAMVAAMQTDNSTVSLRSFQHKDVQGNLIGKLFYSAAAHVAPLPPPRC